MARFIPRERKHKVRQRGNKKFQNAISIENPNETEIIPVSKQEREKKRHELKNALHAQQPKISSKKQKRLDKYIVKGMFRQVPYQTANNRM